MKNLIAFLAIIFLTLGVKAQTTLETAVFNELNSYRAKLSNTQWKPKNANSDYDSNVGYLCKLSMDNDLGNMSNYHARYLSEVKRLGLNNLSGEKAHDQNVNLENWAELSFDDRAYKIKKLKAKKELGGEIQIQAFEVAKGTSDKELARIIISSFDRSDGHKVVMIRQYEEDIVTPIVGISVIISEGPHKDKLYYSVVIDFGVIIK
jgi:hypothetical protein